MDKFYLLFIKCFILFFAVVDGNVFTNRLSVTLPEIKKINKK